MFGELELCCSICLKYYADYEIFGCKKKEENCCKYCLQILWKKSIKPPGCRLCRNNYFSRCKGNLYKDKFDFYKDTNTSRSWLGPEEWLISKFRLSESAINVRARTYVENKMSEAIIKTCARCKMRFIKDGGCNIVTCACGYSVCYICEKPPNLCNSGFDCLENSDEVDQEKIMDAAEEAKKEVGSYLLVDPTLSEKSSVVLSRNFKNILVISVSSVLLYFLNKI